MMKKKIKEYDDITVPINEIRDHVNDMLRNKKKELYFDGIVLLYSFIENILKWLVGVKILWDKCDRRIDENEARVIREFCKRMTFSSALQMALFFKLIDFKLYKRIDTIREERNNIIHQYWLYIHRRNRLVLRKKLEKLAGTASALVGLFNDLTEEIGVGEVYGIFL